MQELNEVNLVGSLAWNVLHLAVISVWEGSAGLDRGRRKMGCWHVTSCWVPSNSGERSWDRSCAECKMLHCLGSDMKSYLWSKFCDPYFFLFVNSPVFP